MPSQHSTLTHIIIERKRGDRGKMSWKWNQSFFPLIASSPLFLYLLIDWVFFFLDGQMGSINPAEGVLSSIESVYH